jgi:hypothetical protein
MPHLSKYAVDLAERVGATAGEAGLGVLIADLGDLPYWWVAVLIPALAMGKGALASFLGRKDTAALLTARADPASRQ